MNKKIIAIPVNLLQSMCLACVFLGMHAQVAQAATFTPINTWTSSTIWSGYNLTGNGLFLGNADYNAMVSGSLGYGLFTLGGSVQTSGNANNAGTSTQDQNNTIIIGDVGVAGNYTNAGTSTQSYNASNNNKSSATQLQNNISISGKLILDSGIVSTSQNNATVTGGTSQSAALGDAVNNALAQGVYDAVNATKTAAALPASPASSYTFTGYTSVTSGTYELNIQNNAIATLNLGTTPNTQTVIKMMDLKLQNNSTLTLVGTATSKIILDITGQFSLQNNANITLSGGIKWNDVLFNIIGPGQDIAIQNNASVTGYVLASQRNLQLQNNAVINGEAIIGGPQVQLQNNSQIIKPPVVSP